jgi:hypothetical protein
MDKAFLPKGKNLLPALFDRKIFAFLYYLFFTYCAIQMPLALNRCEYSTPIHQSRCHALLMQFPLHIHPTATALSEGHGYSSKHGLASHENHIGVLSGVCTGAKLFSFFS